MVTFKGKHPLKPKKYSTLQVCMSTALDDISAPLIYLDDKVTTFKPSKKLKFDWKAAAKQN